MTPSDHPSTHPSAHPSGSNQNAPAEKGAEKAKAKRHIKNFLLQPLLQIKLGIYAILLSVVFAAALTSIMYYNFAGLAKSIVVLTDAEDEIASLVLDYWQGTQGWIYLTIGIYLAATIAISVLYTHKLVGPTYAFRRHIQSLIDGKPGARTFLRRGDAFYEVADDLNRLSMALEAKMQKEDK